MGLRYGNPNVEAPTAEPNVVLVVIEHEMLVQPPDLLLHEGELDGHAVALEVLAVEVHHEVPDYRTVVDCSVMLGGLSLPEPIGSEVRITTSVLVAPVFLQLAPIMD